MLELLQHHYRYIEMTIAVIKEGPYYVTEGTPISFSSLRTNFRATNIDETVSNDTSSISASQLRRIVSQSISDPTVQDATENVGISTENNLNISQFRNSVKYYKVSQTSTDTNLNISSQTWNSNLSKNIKKKVSINGTIGSSDTNIPALLTTSGQHCNLEIAVTGTGKVIGAGGTAGIGGTAGTPNGGNGGNGGTAMNLLNTLAASVIKVTVVSGANIYGGGGGGGGGTKGGTGGTGANGSKSGGTTFVGNADCNLANQIFRCDGNAQNRTNALAVYLNNGCVAGPNVFNTCGEPFLGPTNGHGKNVPNAPAATTGGVGGPGGNGANGGVGAGYEQALGAAGSGVDAVTDWTGRIGGTNAGTGGKGGKGGDSGAGGTFGANGSPGTQGATGITGGNGSLVDGTVTYGSDGTAGGLPFGTAGDAGSAITGTNYSVTGTISGDTVKGLYNP